MKILLLLLLALSLTFKLWAQVQPAPDRSRGEGPWSQLIIRGVTLIDGTGAPATGPVDVVVEQNVITRIARVGFPGVPIDPEGRPQLIEGGKEIQAEGMYLLPGFVDAHAHIGGKGQGTTAEYVYKLWLAHGITSIREVFCGNGLTWTLHEKRRSAEGAIAAPRIYAYPVLGLSDEGIQAPDTPEEARAWVRKVAAAGVDGVKFRYGTSPEIMRASLDEIQKQGLRSASHHDQMGVARWNVLHSARAGLTSMEHWYGLPEALFEDRTIQAFPLDYNQQNEQHRFGEAGKLWKQAAKPGSARWEAVMEELLALDFSIVPTFTIYEANRDLHRARRAEWHEQYTLPSLWRYYEPSRISHGSYWHDWGTEEEVAWRENFRLWMDFINEYKNRGGRVAAGSDAGFIYKLYGFAYIRELELLREAGFHPIEVLRAATLKGAEVLGAEDEIGTVEVGKKADLVLVSENPLANLKVLYGTGAVRLDENNEVIRAGGVSYTIVDGILYDAKTLLSDVAEMVKKAKAEEGFELLQPGEAKD